MTKNVFILEDQPDGVDMLTRAVMASFPDCHITVAPDLSTATKFLNAEPSLALDFALVDLRLPDGLSTDWLEKFKARNPNVIAIVTSLYDDDELVFAALRAGADGYLLKGDGALNLSQALSKVIQGEPPISPAIARKLMTQFRKEATAVVVPTTQPEHLTSREQEVLALIGTGLMIKQVAVKLGISYYTVNDNIKAIYRKLNIHTRAEAAAEASKRGLQVRPR